MPVNITNRRLRFGDIGASVLIFFRRRELIERCKMGWIGLRNVIGRRHSYKYNNNEANINDYSDDRNSKVLRGIYIKLPVIGEPAVFT